MTIDLTAKEIKEVTAILSLQIADYRLSMSQHKYFLLNCLHDEAIVMNGIIAEEERLIRKYIREVQNFAVKKLESISMIWQQEGTYWAADKITTQYSDGRIYRWTEVKARWSGFGPYYDPKTVRTFIFDKCQIADWDGTPLAAPRWIN